MRCPSCGEVVSKGGVSRYWCKPCKQWWLIQKLSTYDPPKPKKKKQESVVCVVCQMPTDLCICHAEKARQIREKIIKRDRSLLEKLNTGSKKIRVPPKQ